MHGRRAEVLYLAAGTLYLGCSNAFIHRIKAMTERLGKLMGTQITLDAFSI